MKFIENTHPGECLVFKKKKRDPLIQYTYILLLKRDIKIHKSDINLENIKNCTQFLQIHL